MIAGAEAPRIRRALESVVPLAREIIVVLNAEVTDGTDEIARSFGAKVFREAWKGHIAQKNSAAAKAAGGWLLGLDADEVVSPELAQEIRAALSDETRTADFAAFSFPRRSYYCGRWIKHGDWYPDRQTRLWRSGKASWGGLDPHDKLIVQGRVGRLRADLHHYSNESIARQIAKISPYHQEYVKQYLASGRSAGWFELGVRPVWRFIRAYFVRLGFLDGWQGFYIAGLSAFSTLTRYALVREAEVGSRRSEDRPSLRSYGPASREQSQKFSGFRTEERGKVMFPLTLIISTFNQPDYLGRVLAGVSRQSSSPEEVLLADDGSAEETGKLFQEWASNQALKTARVWQEHQGFRKARILNQAIARAESNYLVFLDGDTVPHPQFIADHRQAAACGAFVQGHRALLKKRGASWFGLGEFESDRRRAFWRGQIGGLKHAFRWPWASLRARSDLRGIRGCNLGIWREDLLHVNGDNVGFVGWGREDSELAARLMNAGRRRLDLRGRALCYHLWHPPASREALGANDHLLALTREKRLTRCVLGLGQYLA